MSDENGRKEVLKTATFRSACRHDMIDKVLDRTASNGGVDERYKPATLTSLFPGAV